MSRNEDQDKNYTNIPDIVSVLSSKSFCDLPGKLQKEVLNSIVGDQNDGGIMGRFFGSKKENAAMHLVFTICAILMALCAIDIIASICNEKSAYTELVENIIPIITLGIGYIVGKGND